MFLQVAHTKTIQVQGLLTILGSREALPAPQPWAHLTVHSFCSLHSTTHLPKSMSSDSYVYQDLEQDFLLTLKSVCFHLSFYLCVSWVKSVHSMQYKF